MVEVSFSHNLAKDSQVYSRVTLYLSERERGGENETGEFDFSRYVWSVAVPETHKKAAECFELLISIAQPKALPADPNQVVTVKWAEGWIERRFPINRVPEGVREILSTMGFGNEDFMHLTFIKEPV